MSDAVPDDGPDFRLPIDDVVPDVRSALADGDTLVVVAAPGAGKTTRLPLTFADEDWSKGRRIIVVEPRRLAARAAAERMAELLGEKVGETIGIRTRFDTRISGRTRIEVVTEGVFTRQVLSDPALDQVACVVFDEFHERALDADFGLALVLDVRTGLRDDLKIVVMSATIDSTRIADFLGGARVVECEGRQFVVETMYAGRSRERPLHVHVADCIVKALRRHEGDVLVFLPGRGEIHRTRDALAERGVGADAGRPEAVLSDVDVLPLFGAMAFADQARVLRPSQSARRRVVLSTAIAETSLTIPGVRIVIDAGLARVARFDPASATTHLETIRVSRASADQRRGRAGRTAPGTCYRLWDEPETRALLAFDPPEILSTDLSSLVLDCADWGVFSHDGLRWIDPPPAGRWAASQEELQVIRALDGDGRLTREGRALRRLPLGPRLSRMVLASATADRRHAQTAAELAVLMSERGLGGSSTDASERLKAFRRDRGSRAASARALAQRWAKQACKLIEGWDGDAPFAGTALLRDDGDVAGLIVLAFPDRLAMARPDASSSRGARAFIMANGRACEVPEDDALARAPFLAVADGQGRAAAQRVLLAARLSRSDLDRLAGERIVRTTEVTYSAQAGAVVARQVERLGAIVLEERPAKLRPGTDVAAALAEGAAQHGVGRLPWSAAQQQLRHRVAFVAANDASDGVSRWPDLSDDALAGDVETWLAPFLAGLSRLDQIDPNILGRALDMLVPWDLSQKLDAFAPTHFEAPTGNRIAIDYSDPGGPVITIRVQELYGLDRHPVVGSGSLPVTLKLLSPAHRPIQITRDLPAFWRGTWAEVKSDMKGRYPKHIWPDDPISAEATARAKPRGR